MESAHSLARRLEEVMLDGTWIALTNWQHQLAQVSWEDATRQVGSLNTIGVLAFHIDYYIGGMLPAFDGHPLEIRDKYSFDAPPLSSADSWDQRRETLLTNANIFIQRVKALSEEELEAPFFDPKYGTFRRNIEGVIEHAYYHLGQVSLIRKLIHSSN